MVILIENPFIERVSSSESAYVDADVSKQSPANNSSQNNQEQADDLFSDSIWDEIDEIVEITERLTAKKNRNKLVRKRRYREIDDTPRDYGLERLRRRRLGEPEDFFKPKYYVCDYCPSETLNVHVFVNHVKEHRETELEHQRSRCNSCGELFNDIIQTKWHQLKCIKRTIVGNL